MQNKSRNRYSNKSLKQGHNSFNDYKGSQGYIKINTFNIFTFIKILTIMIVILITIFYLTNI